MSVGRALFPFPKNLSDSRTALQGRSGELLNALLGAEMTPDEMVQLLAIVRGEPPGRQEAHPNLRRGSQKSLVGVFAERHRIHRNTARRLLRNALAPDTGGPTITSLRHEIRAASRAVGNSHFDSCAEEACHDVRVARAWIRHAAAALDAHATEGRQRRPQKSGAA